MLWQKNLLIPSTLGFRFVAKKLANVLLVYGSLEILHCGKKTCSYLLHMRFKFVAKNLANVFWLRDPLRISCCGKKTCCYIVHQGFKFVAKKLAIAFQLGVLLSGGICHVPRLALACSRRSARLCRFVLRYGVQQS